MSALASEAPPPATPMSEDERDEDQDQDQDVPMVEDVPIRRDELKQKDYYSKWDAFEKEQTAGLDEEEEKQKAESDAALGKTKYAMSEAEARDMSKHEQLKAAKKAWDHKLSLENMAKHEINGLSGGEGADAAASGEARVLTDADLEGKKVLTIKQCRGLTFVLPTNLVGMIKVFIEECKDCAFILAAKLVTSHVEMAHCERCSVEVAEEPLHTMQADLCKGVTLTYGEGLFREGHRVYSAGCEDLNIHCDYRTGDGKDVKRISSSNDFIRDLAPLVLVPDKSSIAGAKADAAAEAGSGAAAAEGGAGVVGMSDAEAQAAAISKAASSLSAPRSEEQHFITRLVPGHGLLTEAAVQVGNRWVTPRELEQESAAAREVTAAELREASFKAEREKLMGNQSFTSGEYAQAAVHYTLAIDLANTADSQSTQFPQPVNPILHACYSNRAQCFLKLGQPEKALEDSDMCIKVKPDFVKGHFRRGIALHAMGRYQEALPSLGKAQELEDPKKKQSLTQIKQAITFAEAKLAGQMRKMRGGR